MRNLLIAVSATLALISPIIYSRSIFKGVSRPHRTTRFVLLIIGVLTFTALFAAHDRVAIWLAGASAIQSTVVFILSIKYGMGGWGRLDLICLFMALIGIGLWQVTKNPILALYAAIAADFTGYIPALVKTFKMPHTESYGFYSLDSVAAMTNLFALSRLTAAGAAYPVYLLFINFAMVILITRPAKLFGAKIKA